MDLSFYSGDHQFDQMVKSLVIITGATRSGKTTLGNVLGSCKGVEHIDDPWLSIVLPTLAASGSLSESLAINMFRAHIMELIYDRLLMRNANFRPADLSSVWSQKDPQEILTRLIGLYTREEVRSYIIENPTVLVLTLANTVGFYTFFRKAFPKCDIVHVVRGGLEVAQEVALKRWFSDDELIHPKHSDPYRRYSDKSDKVYYLPHWVVVGQEKRYVASSEFARSMQYWRRTMELYKSESNVLTTAQIPLTIRFSDLIKRPADTISELTNSLDMEHTDLTLRLISKIHPTDQQTEFIESLNEIEYEEILAIRDLYKEFDLNTELIDALIDANPSI